MRRCRSEQTAAGAAAILALVLSGSAVFAGPMHTPRAAVAELGKNLSALADGVFPVEAQLSDRLREFLTTKVDRFITRKRDRDGVQAFYKQRDYNPLWLTNGVANDRFKSVAERLQAASADGLDPASYRIPDFSVADAAILAEAELKFTDAVLTYARQAQAGRFDANRVSPDIEAKQILPVAAQVLTKLSGAADAGAALEAYNPPEAGFKALKAELAELRAAKPDAHRIAGGPRLTRGMRDARVPELRERLGLAAAPGNVYDFKLADAVKKFQRENGLRPTGALDIGTIKALNGPSTNHQIDVVIANMERWRWLPRYLGQAYVMVNVPDYSLKVVRDGRTLWTTRIVVGKADTPTPLFSAEIENIVINPTWHVPESIIYNEYLPAMERDPTVLKRMGLVLERERDGKITIKQPPGDDNALGHMKFNFPNRFLVYLHDTPSKNLFRLSKRAFSHGCMRVMDPAKFGEVLTSIAMPKDTYTEDRLVRMWGQDEAWLKLPRKIPVHITYQTAFVNEAGKLVVRDDLYGIDARVLRALKVDDRTFAEAPPRREVKHEPITEARRRQLDRLVPDPRNMTFFERMFLAR